MDVLTITMDCADRATMRAAALPGGAAVIRVRG